MVNKTDFRNVKFKGMKFCFKQIDEEYILVRFQGVHRIYEINTLYMISDCPFYFAVANGNSLLLPNSHIFDSFLRKNNLCLLEKRTFNISYVRNNFIIITMGMIICFSSLLEEFTNRYSKLIMTLFIFLCLSFLLHPHILQRNDLDHYEKIKPMMNPPILFSEKAKEKPKDQNQIKQNLRKNIVKKNSIYKNELKPIPQIKREYDYKYFTNAH